MSSEDWATTPYVYDSKWSYLSFPYLIKKNRVSPIAMNPARLFTAYLFFNVRERKSERGELEKQMGGGGEAREASLTKNTVKFLK